MTMASHNPVLRRHRTVGSVSQTLLVVVIAVAVGFGYWARNQRVTSVAEGSGVVQSLEKTIPVIGTTGGVVRPHDLAEGTMVTEGQLLFRIETVTEVAVAQDAPPVPKMLRATTARLRAEADGAERVVFPKDIDGSAEAARQRALFLERQSKLNRAVQALRDMVRKARLEIGEQSATAVRSARARELAQKELDLLRPLVDRGISPKLEFLRVQQKVQDLDAQREQAPLAVPRLEAAIRGSERRIEETTADFRSQAKQLLAEKQSELRARPRAVVTKKRRVTTTEIRAPAEGEIRRVLVNKSGAAIGAGQELAIISPPVKLLTIDGQVPAYAGEGLLLKEDILVEHVRGFDVTGIGAEFLAIAPIEENLKGPYDVRRITLRVAAGTPGFETLAKFGGRVRITVRYQKPVFDYLLDSIWMASGGRILKRLSGQ